MRSSHPGNTNPIQTTNNRWWMVAGAGFLTFLAFTLLAVTGLWAWCSSEGSLNTTLEWAGHWLPAPYKLEVSGVTGSVRRGGRIAELRWQQPGADVKLSSIELQWRLEELALKQQVVIKLLSIDTLRVLKTPNAEPGSVLETLHLPVPVEAQIHLSHLDVPAAGQLKANGLHAHYAFDGQAHQLDLLGLELAQGHYSGKLTLQAAAPMALGAHIEGQIATRLAAPAPQHLQAALDVQGTLSGTQALLKAQAGIHPDPDKPWGKNPMQARFQADIAPWSQQPVRAADVQVQALDLNLLWPAAPSTQLWGDIKLQPLADDLQHWAAKLALINRQPGPWNAGKLPLNAAQAELRQQGSTWLVDHVEAQMGEARITAHGHYEPQSSHGWQLQAHLENVNPAQLDDSWPQARLVGDINAQNGKAQDSVVFQVNLGQDNGATDSRGSALAQVALNLKTAQATGQWQAGLLTVDRLSIELAEASLQGQLQVKPAQRSGQGDLVLKAPGLKIAISGAIDSDQGQGHWQVQLNDAASLSRWSRQWMLLKSLSAALPSSGEGQFNGQWLGGWGALASAWNVQAQGSKSKSFDISANLSLPRLDWPSNSDLPGWSAQNIQGQLVASWPGLRRDDSSPAPIQLSLNGAVKQGQMTLNAQTVISGGQRPATRAGQAMWKVDIEQLKLSADPLAPGSAWELSLSQSAQLSILRQPSNDSTELLLAPGQATMSHPTKGSAALQWDSTSWSYQAGQSRWQTQGSLRAIPMAWIEQLASLSPETGNLGIAGDIVLGAQWAAQYDGGLSVKASLIRQSGDLRLQADEIPDAMAATEAQRSAGVKQAQLSIQLLGQQLQAQLDWDSVRAGQIKARVATTLSVQGGAWTWPEQAPISGEVNAQMPRLGVWSMLAPPGWRMRGTLNAKAELSGTRQNPQWLGEIEGKELALRSAVEGIELREGHLRAVLDGHQIDIPEFTLQGAPGAGGDGGRLSASGQARWNAGHLEIDLQTRADHLRVSARADRRLAVSGQITTRLAQNQVTVRGQLKADQALFILPDESSPTLGTDVVVLNPKALSPGANNSNGNLLPAATASGPAPDVQVTLDLGEDFRVQGRGLKTRLRGSVTLRITSAHPSPQVSGELRTDQGNYKAYGQQLNIEQGVMRFNGAYDNPSLDILAIRPNLSVRVGVQISGTVLSPKVRLYSEPEMADADKLAWLVLGRAAANGAAESAVLQQAALTLLGGGKGLTESLANAIGLDEVSFSGVKNTDTGVSSAALTLGKRLSKDFYVSYERSLAGTVGTFYVFYDLSRRFTLRAQTGEKSAVDLIYTIRYD
jgi:translocation and assembly module TamB